MVSDTRAAEYFVAPTGDNTHPGTEAQPFKTIQKAIQSSAAGDVIRVAAGTYTEGLTWNHDLQILGAGEGLSILRRSYGTIIEASNLSSASLLSGFTIQDSSSEGGSGMVIQRCGLTISHCTFRDLIATKPDNPDLASLGGALFFQSGNLRLIHCTFIGNQSYDIGGAIFALESQPANPSSLQLDHCDFINNRATQGGAVVAYLPNLSIRNCRFLGNTATHKAAAVDEITHQSISVNNLFAGNILSLNSQQSRAMVYNSFGRQFTMVQCTFVGNESPSSSHHALEIRSSISASVRNCIFWGNSGEAYRSIGQTPDVQFSILQGLANTTPGLAGNFAADPLFVDPANGDFRLGPFSPAINRGDTEIVSVPPFATVSGVIVDLAGNPRIDSDFVDIGAFEFQNAAPIAMLDTYTTSEDTPLVVSAPGVLENDSDPDGHPLTVEVKKAPQFGSVELNPDGSFSYVPGSGFAGSDSFTYTVSDFGSRATGQVKITVRAVIKREDLDGNGCVDVADLSQLLQAIRLRSRDPKYDLNQDGQVNIADSRWLVLRFTRPGGAPCSDND